MKTSLFALSFALTGVALAQSPVLSLPVGAVEIQISAAPNTLSPSLTSISLPFHGPVTHVGVLSSLDEINKLSAATSLWVAGEHVSSPKFFRLLSGLNAGRIFPVTANTSTQITLQTGSLSLVSGAPRTPSEISISTGDKFEIVTENTLGSVFGTSSTALLSGASSGAADNVLLFDGTNWTVYFHNGVAWQSDDFEGPQNNQVISRGSAFFVRRRALTPTRLLVAGTVPSKAEPIDLPSVSSRLTGHRLPLKTTLQGLGLHTSTGWRSGPSAASSDSVQIWGGSTWLSFYHNGTQWRRTGSLLNYNSQPIPLGSGMFVIRQGNNAADVTVSLPTPYSF